MSTNDAFDQHLADYDPDVHAAISAEQIGRAHV